MQGQHQQLQPPKQEELSEAIKRAAAEHQLKRQSSQDLSAPVYRVSLPNGSNAAPALASLGNRPLHKASNVGSAAVKNELERALESRLRKQQEQESQQSLTTTITNPVIPISSEKEEVNKRNIPRAPPPCVPVPDMAKSETQTAAQPPPPPPPMSPLFARSKLLSNNSSSSFPPPPSPLALRRLSTTDRQIFSAVSPCPPPPPPPLPLSVSSSSSASLSSSPTPQKACLNQVSVENIKLNANRLDDFIKESKNVLYFYEYLIIALKEQHLNQRKYSGYLLDVIQP